MDNDSPLMALIKSRQSVRAFTSEPVPRELITQCVEAARLAPSACNVQPCRYVVLDEPDMIQSFSKSAFGHVYMSNKWVARAPVIVIILARLDLVANRIGKLIQGTPYYLLDGAIAGEHFVLRAQELGLGTCWLGWFSEKSVKKFLSVPRGFRVVSCLAVGYSQGPAKDEKKKLPLEDILSFNRFDNK